MRNWLQGNKPLVALTGCRHNVSRLSCNARIAGCGFGSSAGSSDILITCQAEAALFHERNAEQRNPLIMVCASGAMAVRILVFSTRLITWLRRRALGSLVTAKASRLGNFRYASPA